MKRLISLIAVVALLVTMVPVTFGFEIENWQTFYTPYDDDTPHGLLPANYFADAVMKYHSVGGWDDETEDAESSGPGSGDVTVGQSEGSILYVGFEEKFDGFVLDMSTPAEYGSYVVEYWSSNGSGEWIEIVEEPVWWDSDLVNDVTTGESFSLTWDDRPSDWVEVEVNGSDAYYYVRLRITADYYNIAYANNAAIIDYNLMIELFNELDEPVTGLEANTIPGFFFVTAERSQTDADGYIYDFNDDEEDEGTYYLALHAPIGAEPEYDYSISAEGYVTIQGVDVNLGKDRDGWFFDDTSGMQYSHVLNVVNSVGGALDIESADVGSSSLDCDINDGLAYCAVPYGEDGSTSYAYTYIDGHVMGQTSLPDRDYYTDAQEETEVEMLVAYLATVDNEDGDGVTGATVTAGDSYGTECIEIGSGDYGCPVPLADTSAGIMVVADGYEEFTGEFSYERTWHDDDQVAGG